MSPPQGQYIQGMGGSIMMPTSVPPPGNHQIHAPEQVAIQIPSSLRASLPFAGMEGNVLRVPKLEPGTQQEIDIHQMASMLQNIPHGSAPFTIVQQQRQVPAQAQAVQQQKQPQQQPQQQQQQQHMAPSSAQVVYLAPQPGQGTQSSTSNFPQAQQLQIPASLLVAAQQQQQQTKLQQQQIPIQTITLQSGQQIHLIPQQFMPADIKPICTTAPTTVQAVQQTPSQATMQPASAGLTMMAELPGSLRAQQLARYRNKRNNRIRAITEGQKKIRYQCRKTLADARPRVKGRFAKVHTDSNPASPKSGSARKNSRMGVLKESARIQTVMSAVDLTSLTKQAALAEDHQKQQQHQAAKLEEMGDMDEFNPMWWLNDGSNDNSSSNDTNSLESPANSILDDIVNGDIRRCYSENNLMQFESADVQAALEVLQTEQNFNNICMGLQQQ